MLICYCKKSSVFQVHRKCNLKMASKKKTKGKTQTSDQNEKNPKSPLFEEDLVDGFAFFSFKTLDDIAVSID